MFWNLRTIVIRVPILSIFAFYTNMIVKFSSFCSIEAVVEAFVRLHEKGLIYQGINLRVSSYYGRMR